MSINQVVGKGGGHKCAELLEDGATQPSQREVAQEH